jgi:pantoate--beta-alanine ligase
MEIVHDIPACRRAVAAARRGGASIGFVPTMGGLHAGHLSLLARARADGHFIVASVFVNPTQFGPGEDYEGYPRTLGTDARLAEAAGCGLLFVPPATEMYEADGGTRVRPGGAAEGLCGPFRPGHFEGVCTVVAKLFNIVQPDVAYFGQKDGQQAAVIRQMAADLNFPVRIEVCPIVREPDGLACSTRNQYLSVEERARAAVLYRALCAGRDAVRVGERRSEEIVAVVRRELAAAEPCAVDYVSVVDAETMSPLERVEGRAMLALAVRIGPARLIDNVVVEAARIVNNQNV